MAAGWKGLAWISAMPSLAQTRARCRQAPPRAWLGRTTSSLRQARANTRCAAGQRVSGIPMGLQLQESADRIPFRQGWLTHVISDTHDSSRRATRSGSHNLRKPPRRLASRAADRARQRTNPPQGWRKPRRECAQLLNRVHAKIHLGRLQTRMAQPERDLSDIARRLERMDRTTVTKHGRGYFSSGDRRHDDRRGFGMQREPFRKAATTHAGFLGVQEQVLVCDGRADGQPITQGATGFLPERQDACGLTGRLVERTNKWLSKPPIRILNPRYRSMAQRTLSCNGTRRFAPNLALRMRNPSGVISVSCRLTASERRSPVDARSPRM